MLRPGGRETDESRYHFSDDLEGDQRAPHDQGDSVPVELAALEKLGLVPRSNIGMDEVELMYDQSFVSRTRARN